MRNSLPEAEREVGRSGIESDDAIMYMAVMGFSSEYGGRPRTISMTVQPTLQISALRHPVDVTCPRITSGAM